MANGTEEKNGIMEQTTCKRTSSKECDILQAATELFSESGYAGTTTLAIAKKANVSEKTMFKYFATKQELYEKALNPAINCFVGGKQDSLPNRDSGIRAMLRDLFLEKIHLTNQDPNILKLTIHEFISNPEFRSALSEEWANRYLPVLLPQIELSEHSRAKYGEMLEGSLTRALIGILTGYAFDKCYIRPDRKFDDEKEIEFMLDLLFIGINGLKSEMGNDYDKKE